jgi:hypothetical protein
MGISKNVVPALVMLDLQLQFSSSIQKFYESGRPSSFRRQAILLLSCWSPFLCHLLTCHCCSNARRHSSDSSPILFSLSVRSRTPVNSTVLPSLPQHHSSAPRKSHLLGQQRHFLSTACVDRERGSLLNQKYNLST